MDRKRLDFSASDVDAAGMLDGSNPRRPDRSARFGRNPRPASGRVADAWNKASRNPSAMIIASAAIQSLMRMGSNIVLARLLAPSAFAMITITMLILTGITMISDVGIALTALREGGMSREDEHRLWTMQLVRGVLVGLLVAAAAVPIGWVYRDAQLTNVLLALALMPVLQGAQSLYPILALKHRRLLPSTLLELGSRVAGIILSILVAFVSPTVWSLVIGTLAGVVFSTIGSHWLAGYRSRFVFDRAYIARQWRFSRWIQASSTLYFIGGQIDKPLFPFLFGMTTFGLYGIGAALAAMPTQITHRWSASVFYPLTTQLLLGGPAARAQLLRVRTTMLLYTAAMALTVVAISPAFFMLLYEPQYHDATRFAQILALGIFFDTAESSLRHMPLVESTPHYEVLSVVVKLAVFVAAAAIVVALGGDAFSYVLAVIIGGAAGHLFMLTVCVRRGYVGAWPDILLISTVIVAAVVMYLLPLPRADVPALLIEGAVVGTASVAAVLFIYLRRGLPSLSAEPAPETLREVAEEELGTIPKPA